MANNYILPPIPGSSSSVPTRKQNDRGTRSRIPTKYHHTRSKSSSDFLASRSASSGPLPSHRYHHSQSFANINTGHRHASSSGSQSHTVLPTGVKANTNTVANEDETVLVDGTFASVPASHTVTRPPSPTPTADFSIISPPSPTSFVHVLPPSFAQAGSDGVYDVIASPTSGPEGTPTCTFFVSPARPSLGIGHSQSFGPSSSLVMRRNPARLGRATLEKIWNVLSTPTKRTRLRARIHPGMYSDLPLDGEEGELIDEACYIDVASISGIDIVGLLPPEIALYLLSFLDLKSILACRGVCHKWYALTLDSVIWRELFYTQQIEHGWKINEREARRRSAVMMRQRVSSRASSAASIQASLSKCSNYAVSGTPPPEFGKALESKATLSLNWEEMYKTRLELDRRWVSGEPKMLKISGHEDSVYCLEFDSKKIITGSRDRTIKIWDLKTGKLRHTLRGHAGSVLCLKFDKDETDPSDPNSPESEGIDTGFMVSGSSDCTMFVWDLNELWKSGKTHGGPELVKRVLRGHIGGVLDLKMDKKWIVSCSKDTLIRIWDRQTFELASTLRGHEGPVNAVGLQGDRVVSASGDGKMMLWDITTGTRIRTFEGHDRGLACIEFKGDLIVSGSNDCKIKLWRASTGECLRTLIGHDLLVRSLSFDPVSQRLVSASYDRSVKVWDMSTGKIIREFKHGHTSHIFDVKFDVSRIVSTSYDQKVVVLDFGVNLDTRLFL